VLADRATYNVAQRIMLREADKLLTVPEVARRLRQSQESIYRKIRSGEIPAVRIGSGPRPPLRVNEAELAEWLYGARTEARDR